MPPDRLSVTGGWRAQERKVATVIGAEDFLRIELGIAALGLRWRPACAAAARRFNSASSTRRSMRRSLTERRMRSPLRTRPSGPPEAESGRHMQHDGAERGAAHARVGDADHVLDAALRELLRDRQVAGLGHAFGRVRAGILQHQHVLRRNVERRIVDARGKIGERGEHHRPALVLEQPGIGRRALEDGAPRREVAEQRDETAVRLERLIARRR